MRNRHSTRRLLLSLALSQALALQALILAWSGTQTLAGGVTGAIGAICSAASASNNVGGTEPPNKPAQHQDCLAACTAGHAAATPPEPALSLSDPAVFGQIFMPVEALLLERSGTQVFSARAPPTLT